MPAGGGVGVLKSSERGEGRLIFHVLLAHGSLDIVSFDYCGFIINTNIPLGHPLRFCFVLNSLNNPDRFVLKP